MNMHTMYKCKVTNKNPNRQAILKIIILFCAAKQSIKQSTPRKRKWAAQFPRERAAHFLCLNLPVLSS